MSYFGIRGCHTDELLRTSGLRPPDQLTRSSAQLRVSPCIIYVDRQTSPLYSPKSWHIWVCRRAIRQATHGAIAKESTTSTLLARFADGVSLLTQRRRA